MRWAQVSCRIGLKYHKAWRGVIQPGFPSPLRPPKKHHMTISARKENRKQRIEIFAL